MTPVECRELLDACHPAVWGRARPSPVERGWLLRSGDSYTYQKDDQRGREAVWVIATSWLDINARSRANLRLGVTIAPACIVEGE